MMSAYVRIVHRMNTYEHDFKGAKNNPLIKHLTP